MKLARRAPFAVLVAILLLFATFVPPLSAAVPPDPPSAASPAAFSCHNVTEIPKSECEALVALYNSTDSIPGTLGALSSLRVLTLQGIDSPARCQRN